MATVELFFDCSSPWTYLAFHNLQPLAAELGATIQWRPILVGGVFNAVNPIYSSTDKPVPAKQEQSKKILQDWARLAGLKILGRPSVFPVNSVKAMRGCVWLEAQSTLIAFATATFEAYWRDDRDISQIPVLTDICRTAGVDPEAFFAGIEQQAVKDRLRANTQELIDRGGFGSPTMFIGDDMYFGNDRLPLVRAALLREKSVRSDAA